MRPSSNLRASSRILITLALGLSVAGAGRSQSAGFVASPDEIETFDPSTGIITDSVFVNYGNSFPFAVSSDQQTLYLTGDSNFLEVVSAQTGAFLDQIKMPTRALKVLLSSDGARAFVRCQSEASGSVAIVSLSTMRVTGVITASSGAGANDMALSPDGTTVYVAFSKTSPPAIPVGQRQPSSTRGVCPVSNGICAFNTGTLALTAEVKGIAGNLAMSQDGNSLYVSTYATRVYVVNTSTLAIGAIGLPAGVEPLNVIVSPVGNSAIVYSNSSPNGIGVLKSYVLDTSTNKLTGVFPAALSGATSGGRSDFAAFSPDGSSLWTVVTCVPGSAGCSGNPATLVGQTFPGGDLIGQTALPSSSYVVAF